MTEESGSAPDAAEPAPAPDTGSRVWGTAAFAAVGAGFLLWWFSLALRYPYFYLFDMDLLAPLEALNINSGLEPTVTLHPGYGMYVLDAFTLRIASFFHLVSAVDLRSVDGSLSPLLPMAELTSFFRLHSPILVLGISLSLWAAVARVGRFSLLMSVIALAAIASAEGLAYQAAIIRVDLYSTFFWSLALPLAMLAASARRPSVHTALLVAAGFLLGVAFLTKIQSGVHLVSAALAYWLVRSLSDDTVESSDATNALRTRRFGLILASVNLVVLAALLIAARYTTSQHFTLFGWVDEPGTYAGAPSRRALAVAGGAILLLLLQLPRPTAWRPLAALSITARTATVVVAGGILAILSPLVLYRDLATGMRFALHNLQNLFWTDLFLYRTAETTENILTVVSGYHWWMIAALAAAGLLAIVATMLGRRPRQWTVLPIAIAWAGFAVAVNIAVVRTAPRDMLWFDTAYSLAIFMLLAIASRMAIRGRRVFTAATIAVALFVCAGNIARLTEVPGRMDTNYHIYGWSESPWFDSWFASPRYNAMMKERYPESQRALAARQARGHYRLRNITAHVFQNADVTLAQAGPLGAGVPLWRNHREWIVKEFPRGYAFSHVIDALELPLKSHTFLSHVWKHEEWLDRVVPPPAEALGPNGSIRALSILPRRDIEVVIFVTVNDLPHVSAADDTLKIPAVSEDAMKITVTSQGIDQHLYGVVLPRYVVLPVADFSNPYVFVVRERSLPPAFGLKAPDDKQPTPESPSPPPAAAPAQDAVKNDTAP